MADPTKPPIEPTDLRAFSAEERDRTGDLQLVVLAAEELACHPLPRQGIVTIGRDPSCAIVLRDKWISRRHVSVHLGEAQVEVLDLDSSHGSFVGQQRIEPGARVPLRVGELLRLGRVAVMLQEVKQATTTLGDRMAVVYDLIDKVAAGNISVLICGETGVGKERISERVHTQSPRSDGPLIKLNCGAFTESLLESELFGHKKGAFTGATSNKVGLIAAANGGSLFLDEVGELPATLQVKLLRAVENQEVRPVGETVPTSVDVRFISATHRNLEEDVASGRFREDLFYRLAGVMVSVPPLRDRLEELPTFVQLFLGQEGQISPDAMDWLATQRWPGNIRQLRNTIERAVLLAAGAPIGVQHLADPSRPQPRVDPSIAAPPPSQTLRGDPNNEKARIAAALEQTGGNQTAAAKLLGISRRTLINRLEKYGLPRPRKR